MNYSEQKSWKEIANFLPAKLHFTSTYQPEEEWWNWKENKVHLDTFRNPNAKAKVILFHGVGTNGRQMSTIIGGPLSKDGFEIIAIDMPLYGVTEVNKNMTITYDDWINLGNDYINYELSKDSRPIFLYGLSAGSSVPLKFIYTYMTYTPDIESENFDICPILLTQPKEDKWTPLHLSMLFLNKIKKVPVKIVELEKGSHYPIEESALDQLHSYILEFTNEHLNIKSSN